MVEQASGLLKGAPVAKSIRDQVSEALASRRLRPRLVNVVCGELPASASYLDALDRLSAKVGIASTVRRLAEDAPQAEVVAAVTELGADDTVHGVMVQFPLPDGVDARAVAGAVPPAKDVDGLTEASLGAVLAGERRHTAPATAAAVIELLVSRPECDPAGREVVVIGRSLVVGRPLAAMIMDRGPGGNGTVTVCHRATPDLPAIARRADVLIVAAGQAQLVRAHWVKPGAVVIDVGTHPVTGEGGRTLVGDVHAEVAEVAGWLTPVPGGVGPVTNAVIMRHVAAAACPDAFPASW